MCLFMDNKHFTVRRGGTLLVYGVYEDKARVKWNPMKIFGDEITVSVSWRILTAGFGHLGSVSHTHGI